MKIFEVEMTAHYSRTIHVKAPNREAAEALVEAIFMDTDAVKLTKDDLECLDTFALSVDGSDDDEDEGACDCCCDEDEELPFDEASNPRDNLLEMMQSILDALSDRDVHIHISP